MSEQDNVYKIEGVARMKSTFTFLQSAYCKKHVNHVLINIKKL